MVLEEFKFDFQALTEKKQTNLKDRDVDYILLTVEQDQADIIEIPVPENLFDTA